MIKEVKFNELPDVKLKVRFNNAEDLVTAGKLGVLEVGYELVTEDIDGVAVFEVADIRKKKIILCRKYLLKDERAMGTEGELLTWLDNEYYESLPTDLKELMKARKDSMVFLPKEVEVFGEHVYSSEEEKGRQWEIFKRVKKRISAFSAEDEHSRWYWLASPYVSSSAAFCIVGTTGAADSNGASGSGGVLPCFCLSLQ